MHEKYSKIFSNDSALQKDKMHEKCIFNYMLVLEELLFRQVEYLKTNLI
jgi:hypothetical protein